MEVDWQEKVENGAGMEVEVEVERETGTVREELAQLNTPRGATWFLANHPPPGSVEDREEGQTDERWKARMGERQRRSTAREKPERTRKAIPERRQGRWTCGSNSVLGSVPCSGIFLGPPVNSKSRAYSSWRRNNESANPRRTAHARYL